MTETLVFSTSNDERGYSSRRVILADDGSLVIEGHDLGGGVEDFWGSGNSEYEFSRTIEPAAVATLRDLLGVGDTNLLPVLRARFGSTTDLEEFLEKQGIASAFWSRVGD